MRKSKSNIVESMVQILIMVAIGVTSAAASFTHVHDLVAAHGQAGWLAWADAVTLELMSIATGLDMRRRKRQHRSVVFPFTTLIIAVSLSLSAQVLQAEQSIIGWIAAAIPALGFLTMAKMVMGRQADAAMPAPAPTAVPQPPAPATAPQSPGMPPLPPSQVPDPAQMWDRYTVTRDDSSTAVVAS